MLKDGKIGFEFETEMRPPKRQAAGLASAPGRRPAEPALAD